MKRDDACTKSYSHIHADENGVLFSYQPDPWKNPRPMPNIDITSIIDGPFMNNVLIFAHAQGPLFFLAVIVVH